MNKFNERDEEFFNLTLYLIDWAYEKDTGLAPWVDGEYVPMSYQQFKQYLKDFPADFDSKIASIDCWIGEVGVILHGLDLPQVFEKLGVTPPPPIVAEINTKEGKRRLFLHHEEAKDDQERVRRSDIAFRLLLNLRNELLQEAGLAMPTAAKERVVDSSEIGHLFAAPSDEPPTAEAYEIIRQQQEEARTLGAELEAKAKGYTKVFVEGFYTFEECLCVKECTHNNQPSIIIGNPKQGPQHPFNMPWRLVERRDGWVEPYREEEDEHLTAFATRINKLKPLEARAFVQYHYDHYTQNGGTSLLFLDHLEFEVLPRSLDFATIHHYSRASHDICQRWLTDKRPECESHVPASTETMRLKEELRNYAFFDLKMIKALSAPSVQQLVENISSNKLPYRIAMLAFLGFDTHLLTHYCQHTKNRLNKCLADILNSDSRIVKGQLAVLDPNCKENRSRYTAYAHKELVKKYYERLK